MLEIGSWSGWAMGVGGALMAALEVDKQIGFFLNHDLGSGLIDQSQKMTVAAMAMADMKVCAHRS
jgi:hypothetical protein